MELQAKTDPRLQQFVDDFKRHKATQAADKNVPPETMEKAGDTYGGAFREDRAAPGHAVCAYAALVLMMLGVTTFRQTTKSSPAAFAGFHRAVERWSSLLWLVLCLISVWSATTPGWMEEIAYISIIGWEGWVGHWVKESRLHLAGVDFLQGKIIAATCIAAVLVVAATVLRRWNRAARAATLSVAGLVLMTCAVHFRKSYVQDSTTISWEDFQAVAQHGVTAAKSAETRRFLAEHPRYVGQLVELEGNVQALAAELVNPFPDEVPKKTVTKSADGNTTTTTLTSGNPLLTEARNAQARKLAAGGGVVGLYQSATMGPQLSLLFGFGLFLLGIRDGYRASRQGRERRSKTGEPGTPVIPALEKRAAQNFP